MIIFQQTYSGESIADVGRDVHEAFGDTEQLNQIPVDRHGFMQGMFTITIEWNE